MSRLFFLLFLVFLGVLATLEESEEYELSEERYIDDNVYETFQSPAATPAGTPLWQPKVGEKWQIILNSTINLNSSMRLEPRNVKIFEVDTFDTPKATIQELRRRDIKVICYFSAGTSEDWRPDFAAFKNEDKGGCLPKWVGERYIDIRKEGVWAVMKARIALAADKGCDAIDPDNIGI
jgi:hypothetical protein